MPGRAGRFRSGGSKRDGDRRAQMVGWAHPTFGKSPPPGLQGLIGEVWTAALAHAGITAADVGFAAPGLEQVPAVHGENARATCSAAIHAACDRIESGRARIALVIGAEKMTAVRASRRARSCSRQATRPSRPPPRLALPASSGRSRPHASSATATAAPISCASRPRTTRTLCTTPSCASAGIWGSISAIPFQTATCASRGRSGARIARASRTGWPRSCAPRPRSRRIWPVRSVFARGCRPMTSSPRRCAIRWPSTGRAWPGPGP